MSIKQLIFTTFLIMLCACSIVAQNLSSESPVGCEENEARLDRIAYLLSEQNDSTNVLIIITRLGSGENSFDLNNHRLHNAREYLLNSPLSIPKDRIITAVGEKTDGLGRVEFYFGGKKIESLLTWKNRPLCVDCCENRRIKPYKRISNQKGQNSKRKKG